MTVEPDSQRRIGPQGRPDRYFSEVLALFLVALSVGLDNLGAATAIGVSGVDSRRRLHIALIFGTFEAVMPLVGLLLGRSLAHTLGGNTKAVAGIALGLVGTYMIVGELLEQRAERERAQVPSLARMLVLGATLSFDNVAIGFALGTYRVNVFVAALVIAAVSVAFTLVGLEAGGRLGGRIGQRSELVGGAMLLGIGIAVGTGAI